MWSKLGISPFVIDLKNISGEGLDGIPISKNGKTPLPHHRIEELISQRFMVGGYLDDWETWVEKLDRADGLEDFVKMKRWTDQMALTSDGIPLSIIYQFEGNRLQPVRLRK